VIRDIFFEDVALKYYQYWEKHDKKIFKKIVTLLAEIRETPFTGTGKPEPLKHQLTGCWSRRITHEHRLVYQVTDQSIIVISCRFHY
jgi:toxin YoeB